MCTVLVLAVALGTVSIAPVAVAVSTYWVVDIAMGDNANTGSSESPLRTIEAAIARSSAGDTILVRPGVYRYDAEQDFPILLPAGVRLMSLEGPEVTSIVAYDDKRTLRIVNPTEGTGLSGFTITSEGVEGGVVIQRSGGTPPDNCPLIEDCIIEGNAAPDGGGIWVDGVPGSVVKPRIVECVIRDNDAEDGGGLYLGNHTSATLLRCSIEGNRAEYGGGLLSPTTFGLFIYECTIDGNTAYNSGGGLHAPTSGADIVIASTRFADNTAGTMGGGAWISGSNPSIRSCEIVGNSAATGGGGYFQYGSPTFENCLLAENDAATGGAGYLQYGDFNLYNCTIANNTGTWAGIYPLHAVSGAEAYNCVFWGNGGNDIRNATVIEYCDTQDTDPAADNNTGIANVIHADPQFVGGGDYRLKPGSPCIDAGSPTVVLPEDYFGTERPQDGDGDGAARADIGYHEYVVPEVARLAGTDRYKTAVAIIKERYASNTTAIIASGENYPDALSAAGLAGTHGAALLLVRRDSVPAVVATALKDLGVTYITIVGGPAAVSETVQTELAKEYTVSRVYGADRYATAVAVAEEIAEENGSDFSKTAFLARGDSFPDALALSPLSFRGSMFEHGAPILLTRPGSLPAVTASALTDRDIDRVYVAGGEAAVSASTKAAVDALLVANGGSASTRWAGNDRYATAVKVAEGGAAKGYGWFQTLGIATGTNFPDALVGGCGLGAVNGVLLLTRPDVLSSATGAAIEDRLPDIHRVEILGGSAAVSDSVRAQIEAKLGL